MKKFTAYLAICTTSLFLIFSSPSLARAYEWNLDGNHSSIRFGIKHIFSTVWGNFSDFEGKILFDPDNLDQSSFDFTVKVNSINTLNGKRDTHLRSDDFFSADKFPLMQFRSTKIIHKQGSTYVVAGTMTLKETQIPMEIPFTFHGTAPSPFNKGELVAGFDTEFFLNRLEFGVGSGKFFQMGVVGDQVHVQISLEAIRKI